MTSAAATSFAPVFDASASAERKHAIISVHDVAPPTWESSARIVAEIARLGVRVCSLLVVPDYHHRGLSTDNPGFVRWLRDCEADGHEVVVHGYYHQRPRRQSESVRDQWITRFYTSDEGEFYDLPYDQALDRVTKAREQFSRAQLKPSGFIAPAWLLGDAAERAITDVGFEYTTRLTNVRDLRSRETIRARSLVYSVRSGWRRQVSLAWNAALAFHLRDAPLLRLGLHPPDIEHGEVWQQIGRIGRKLAAERTLTTYRDWVADRRLHSSS